MPRKILNVSSYAYATEVSSPVVQNNFLRSSITICNNGAYDVWLGKSEVATVYSGVLLKAGGGSYTESRSNPAESVYTGSYSAITAVNSAVFGSMVLSVSEDSYDFYI